MPRHHTRHHGQEERLRETDAWIFLLLFQKKTLAKKAQLRGIFLFVLIGKERSAQRTLQRRRRRALRLLHINLLPDGAKEALREKKLICGGVHRKTGGSMHQTEARSLDQ